MKRSCAMPRILSRTTGGLAVLDGPLGRAVIKTSAVPADRLVIEAPVRIFHDQAELQKAFKAGELNGDFIAVVRFQGPKANGMPELAQAHAALGRSAGSRPSRRARDRRPHVGRLRQGSRRHPRFARGGRRRSDRAVARWRSHAARRRDGRLDVLVDEDEWSVREPVSIDLADNDWGVGRELFAPFRRAVGRADHGASIFEVV